MTKNRGHAHAGQQQSAQHPPTGNGDGGPEQAEAGQTNPQAAPDPQQEAASRLTAIVDAALGIAVRSDSLSLHVGAILDAVIGGDAEAAHEAVADLQRAIDRREPPADPAAEFREAMLRHFITSLKGFPSDVRQVESMLRSLLEQHGMEAVKYVMGYIRDHRPEIHGKCVFAFEKVAALSRVRANSSNQVPQGV